jgi:hypothetical protein
MLNLDKVNVAAQSAFEAGDDFLLLVVRCLTTGNRFVSVRSVTPMAFVTGLRACAKDRNFGAYNSPVLESMRLYGSDGHSIALVSTHKTRKQANMAKKALVESMATKSVVLNWNRPVKGMPKTDFAWMSNDEFQAVSVKPKRTKKPAATATETDTVSA